MIPAHRLISLALVGALASTAAADEAGQPPPDPTRPTASSIARAAAHYARRSIAVGPWIGASAAYALEPEYLDTPISFGVALLVFRVVPDPADAFRDRANLAAQLAGRPRRDRVVEKPSVVLSLEGAYFPRAGDWQGRLSAGYGLRVITLSISLAGHFGDANWLYSGLEAAVHLTPRQGPRSPVVDVFARFDYGVTSATEDAHQLGGGLRVLLDLI